MSRDYNIGDAQDLLAAGREGALVGRVVVVFWSAGGQAPGVRAGHHPAIGLHQPGDVLSRVAGRGPQAHALLETLASQLLLHGNAYVQVLKDASGKPVELYALRPERVSVIAVEPTAS